MLIYVSIRLSSLEVGRNFRCKFQWLHNFGEGEKVHGYTHCAKNSIATRPRVSQNSWDFMISSFLSQVFQKKIKHGKKHEPKDWYVFLGESKVFFSSKMWTNLYPKWSREMIPFDQHIFQKLCCCNGTAQVSHYKTWQPQTLSHFLLKCNQVKTTTGFNHPKKKSRRGLSYLVIQAVTFLGWWKRDPFKGLEWPPTIGDEKGTAWITW